MKSSVKTAIVLGLVILVGVLAAGPYVTMNQIEKAINTKDPVKLANYVDFSALRSNLKEQMTASMMEEMVAEDDPFAMFGMALFTALIDGIVDVVLTPNGLMALLSGADLESIEHVDYSDNKADLFKDSRWTVDGLSTVSLRVKVEADELRFVLQRHGLKWRLSNIILPM